MRRCRSWYRIRELLHSRLPLPPGPLADSLALWLQGMLPAENGCPGRVAAALAARGGNVHTLRRRLCDGLKDDAERQDAWGADQEPDVEACFAPLPAWVLSWRVPSGAEAPPSPLALAVDPTHQADRLVALTVSVVLNQTAIPVAWRMVPAQTSLPWMDILCRLLGLLAPAVPPGTAVHVLCDRGLYSPRLRRRIRSLGWHPCLRCDPGPALRAAGRPRPGPGTLTRSSASFTHNPGLRPRGHAPRGQVCASPTQPIRAHGRPHSLGTPSVAAARCTPAGRTSCGSRLAPMSGAKHIPVKEQWCEQFSR